MDLTFRPLSTWPGPRTDSWRRKSRYTFKATRDSTNRKLSYELEQLGAKRAVIEIGLSERHIRKDGLPRGDAPIGAMMDPGVIVSFESKHGPLRYACDGFELWEHNLRAIALGLEALRAVDRYGITAKGEQYRGFAQLPAGLAMGAAMDADEAWTVLCDLGELPDGQGALRTRALIEATYKVAVRLHHPDRGGDPDLFRRATEARDVLLKEE